MTSNALDSKSYCTDLCTWPKFIAVVDIKNVPNLAPSLFYPIFISILFYLICDEKMHKTLLPQCMIDDVAWVNIGVSDLIMQKWSDTGLWTKCRHAVLLYQEQIKYHYTLLLIIIYVKAICKYNTFVNDVFLRKKIGVTTAILWSPWRCHIDSVIWIITVDIRLNVYIKCSCRVRYTCM